MNLLNRNVSGWIGELLESSPIVVVEGARQVGKSTLVSMLGEHSTVFTTMDEEIARAYARDDPRGFLASLSVVEAQYGTWTQACRVAHEVLDRR